jgi:hypothetical protein
MTVRANQSPVRWVVVAGIAIDMVDVQLQRLASPIDQIALSAFFTISFDDETVDPTISI